MSSTFQHLKFRITPACSWLCSLDVSLDITADVPDAVAVNDCIGLQQVYIKVFQQPLDLFVYILPVSEREYCFSCPVCRSALVLKNNKVRVLKPLPEAITPVA